MHQAVGGENDAPTPGDLLCGALAACLDSTLRIIANGYGMALSNLSVSVQGRVDVRGTLRADANVPTAFQRFDVQVAIATEKQEPDKNLLMLLAAAERSCIVLQTLKAGSEITVSLIPHTAVAA